MQLVKRPLGDELLSIQTKSYCSHLDGYSVVTFPKEISKAHLAEIREAGEQVVAELANRKAPHCLVDLTALDYAGSALVASIVRIWKAVDANQGRMVVAVSSKGVREVLRVTGLNKVWTIKSSYEAALDELGFSTRAKNVKRDLRLLAFVGPATLFVGAIAVALSRVPFLADLAEPHDVIANSLIGMAVITSGISIFRERSWRRWLSVVVFVLSATLLGWLIWSAFDRSSSSKAEPAENSAVVAGEKEPSSEEMDSPSSPDKPNGDQAASETGDSAANLPTDDTSVTQPPSDDAPESKSPEGKAPPSSGDQPLPPPTRTPG